MFYSIINCIQIIMSFFQSSWFRKSRFKGGQSKSVNAGGAGLGYRELSGFNKNSVSSNQCLQDIFTDVFLIQKNK